MWAQVLTEQLVYFILAMALDGSITALFHSLGSGFGRATVVGPSLPRHSPKEAPSKAQSNFVHLRGCELGEQRVGERAERIDTTQRDWPFDRVN